MIDGMELSWPIIIALVSLAFGAIGAYGQIRLWILQLFNAQKSRATRLQNQRKDFYQELSQNTPFLIAYGVKELSACIALGVFVILFSSAASSVELSGFWKQALSSLTVGLGALFGGRVGHVSRVMRGVVSLL